MWSNEYIHVYRYCLCKIKSILTKNHGDFFVADCFITCKSIRNTHFWRYEFNYHYVSILQWQYHTCNLIILKLITYQRAKYVRDLVNQACFQSLIEYSYIRSIIRNHSHLEIRKCTKFVTNILWDIPFHYKTISQKIPTDDQSYWQFSLGVDMDEQTKRSDIEL